MTKLDSFKKALSGFEDCYTVIGGTACQVIIDDRGGTFRATHDLDVVVLVDAQGFERFGEAFWGFIREGGYEAAKGSGGEMCFYRFKNPARSDCPKMIELFGKSAIAAPLDIGQRIVPIPLSESLSSLSAILLDEEYYQLLKQGRCIVDGVSVLGVEWLILFKMKARVDLVERARTSGGVDSRDLKKHQKDVFRLWEYADTEIRIALSGSVAQDVEAFFNTMDITSQQLRQMGIRDSLKTIVGELKAMHGLSAG